jgi:predicted kinase
MKSQSFEIVAAPTLILIGGGVGSGKSSISTQIVRLISNAVLLDKDRLYGKWVDELLSAGGHPADRDSRYYWESVRTLEYASLESLAFDHLRLGKAVIVDAPLRPELDSPDWVRRIRLSCGQIGATLVSVWVEISTECAYERMRHRAEPRDRWKLENWDEFSRSQSYHPPCAAKVILPNETPEQKESAIAEIMAHISAV